jgi:hypothetical protein
MHISRVHSAAVMVVLCMTMVAAGWSAPALSADPGPSGRGQGGRLVYMTHAGSEDIAAFRVGSDGRPRRVGDRVPTAAGTSPSPVMFAPDGRTAYVLNRGNNTVAAYRVGARGG